MTTRAVKDGFFPPGNALVEAGKPTWLALRVLGAWPPPLSSKGMLASPTYVLEMAYQLIVLVFMSYRWYEVFTDRLQFLNDTEPGDFARAVLGYQYLVYICSHWIIVLLWLEASDTAVLCKTWARIQPRLEAACGRRLPSLAKRSRNMVIALVVVWPVMLSVSFTNLPGSGISWAQVSSYVHATLTLLLVALQTVENCNAIEKAASLLADTFRENMNQGQPATTLRTYRGLWAELSDVVHMRSEAGGKVSLVSQFVHAVTLVLSAYQVAYSTVSGFSLISAYITTIGLATLVGLAVYCDAAHRVGDEINRFTVLLESLPMVDMDKETAHELDLFRRVMAVQPAQIRLNGVIHTDRAALGELLVVLATYLVVMLQFTF